MRAAAPSPAPRIALIHATRLSMAPIEETFAARWPEAERFHLLEEALAIGTRIGLVATFEPSLGSIGDELRALAQARGVSITITPVFAPDAMAAIGRGEVAAHDRQIAVAARRLASVDVVLLAQFSMARARPAVAAAVAMPVLTSPDSAVDAMRRALTAAPPKP